MKILVVGKGAREHALCWRIARSPGVERVYCAPGNPGINRVAEPVAIAPTDAARLAAFAEQHRIDLTVVGPEEPLVLGIADAFAASALAIFGPTASAARLEASKSFAKQVMRRAGVPTAEFAVFDNLEQARAHVAAAKRPLVIKADGLAMGKGVTVCATAEAALAALDETMAARRFGAAGARVVIEERLYGEELSFFALCDGKTAVPLGFAQDHKPLNDADRGPNTGGMGAYTPVPGCGAELEARVMREVVAPVLRAMAELAAPFKGVLYAGLMLCEGRLNVLEFNVRFGDPECQPMMMRLGGDLAEFLLAAAHGRLDPAARPSLSRRSAVAVVLASAGYPASYRKGLPIRITEPASLGDDADAGCYDESSIQVKLFHAGTAENNGQLVTDGGRVLTVTAAASSLALAAQAAYQAAARIDFPGKQMRSDIARRALEGSFISDRLQAGRIGHGS